MIHILLISDIIDSTYGDPPKHFPKTFLQKAMVQIKLVTVEAAAFFEFISQLSQFTVTVNHGHYENRKFRCLFLSLSF